MAYDDARALQMKNSSWGTLLQSPNMWAVMFAYFT
jgi:hypothetical protein